VIALGPRYTDNINHMITISVDAGNTLHTKLGKVNTIQLNHINLMLKLSVIKLLKRKLNFEKVIGEVR
jgi:hypothetical protein